MKNIVAIISLTLFVILQSCNQYDTVKEYSDGHVLLEEYKIDKDSLMQGEYLSYFEDGKNVFERSHYKDDQLDGERRLYFENGQVEIIENYVRDTLTDTLKVYYRTGALKQLKYFEAGVLTGVITTYYEDGTLKDKATFVNNLEEGPFAEYHPNGQPKWQGTYRNGDKEYGELTQFDNKGVAIRKLMCDTAAVCTTIWTKEDGYLN